MLPYDKTGKHKQRIFSVIACTASAVLIFVSSEITFSKNPKICILIKMERRSGVLLHPTSIATNEGIGTLGKGAFDFIDWLKKSGQTLWQILPLGPTGYGDSPYASFSSFAGNPLLIDFGELVKKHWADKKTCVVPKILRQSKRVLYGNLIDWKFAALDKAANFFLLHANAVDRKKYETFQKRQAFWLKPFALFMSIKNFYDAKAKREKVFGIQSIWNFFWDDALASFEKSALLQWKKNHADEIEKIKVMQFFFETQWLSLKAYANKNGISIIGDVPVFAALDSADVWCNQNLFLLDKNRKPIFVAGVPPDYFSREGQLWGNPLYDWKAMKKENYAWWISRLRRMFHLCDYVRLDHFRGFISCWAVPFGNKNAVRGSWQKTAGSEFFTALSKRIPLQNLIAEDLGVITSDVRSLQKKENLPGMKVLQFAFDDETFSSNFFPHEFKTAHCVCYTGTHDNDTMQSFFSLCGAKKKARIAHYLSGEKKSARELDAYFKTGKANDDTIRLAFSSIAAFAIVPLQDILHLGKDARMNTPSTIGGNWAWRYEKKMLNAERARFLASLSFLFHRNAR